MFSAEEVEHLIKSLLFILFLGNICFTTDASGERCVVMDEGKPALAMAASVLKVHIVVLQRHELT